MLVGKPLDDGALPPLLLGIGGGALMALRDGKARVVLLAKAEHLAATPVERQVIVALQAHRGGKVIECATGDCLSDDPSDEARIIREAVVHVEDLRKKTTAGRLSEARKSGVKVGAKVYGSYPHEAPVVELVMRLRREKGWGVRRIAHELNRRGIVNRAGGKWLPPAIQRIFNRHE